MEPRFKYTITLFEKLTGGLYIVVDHMRFLYGRRINHCEFCIECNTLYPINQPYNHNVKCPLRCPSCFLIGPMKKCEFKEKTKITCNACKR